MFRKPRIFLQRSAFKRSTMCFQAIDDVLSSTPCRRHLSLALAVPCGAVGGCLPASRRLFLECKVTARLEAEKISLHILTRAGRFSAFYVVTCPDEHVRIYTDMVGVAGARLHPGHAGGLCAPHCRGQDGGLLPPRHLATPPLHHRAVCLHSLKDC